MAKHYFLVAALPDITWKEESPLTSEEFLNDWELELAPLKSEFTNLIQFNDLVNLNFLIRQRQMKELAQPESDTGSASELDTNSTNSLPLPCSPSNLTSEALESFLDNPDDATGFLSEYLTTHKENSARLENYDDIYADHFKFLSKSSHPFISQYGSFESDLRTAISAIRARESGLNFDEVITGSEEIVKTILDNRTSADFGLQDEFPQIQDLLDHFQGDPRATEEGIDQIRFEFLEQFGVQEPFEDETVLAFFLQLLILEKWEKLDQEQGKNQITTITTITTNNAIGEEK